jgi:signal transduction histidine kinase
MEVIASLVVIILLIIALTLFYFNNRKQKKTNEVLRNELKDLKNKLTEGRSEQNKLMDINEERKNIVSIVAHDLKSPLNRTYALIRLLSMNTDNLSTDQIDYLGKMHQIIADGLSLVRNMLDIRAIEDRGIEIRKEEFNLSNYLSSELNQFRVLADLKQLELIYKAEPKIFIEADKQYLGRIIDNLISNAIKFSDFGKKIELNLSQVKEAVCISIKDEGPGFKSSELDKVFLKYQKFSAKPTGGESSTGIGLSIVKMLADKMGYTIECFSEEGKGAEFKLTMSR